MSLPIYQRVAVTDAGDVIPGAEYTVINENTGVAAPIYSDRTGATLLSAPYFADSVGTIQFFIAQGTTFRVAASGGVGTYTDRYVYGVAEAVLVDASGNADVAGTVTADGLVVSGATADFLTTLANSTSSGNGLFVSAGDNSGDRILQLSDKNGAEKLRVTALGNVGIGTSSPDSILQAANTDNSTNYISYEIGNNGIGANNKGGFAIYELGSLAVSITYARDGSGHTDINANALVFNNATNTQENMRISGSNLLVGTTEGVIWNQAATDTSKQGVVIEPKAIQISRFQDTPLLINRQGNDGSLQVFAKDGTTVGSIGSAANGTEIYLTGSGSNTAGVFCSNGGSILPMLGGGLSDNTVNIGSAFIRWKDIYATNPNINTSDRNEKQDIEEINAAETAVAKFCKGLLRSFRWKDAVAEKGDDARIHFGIMAQDLQDAFTAEGLDAGRYGMFISNTWWETQAEVAAVEAVDEVTDEDGNVTTKAVEAVDAYTRTDTFETLAEAPEGATERTRLGVRYSELLAFIIAAI